jgi:hypothetical protein
MASRSNELKPDCHFGILGLGMKIRRHESEIVDGIGGQIARYVKRPKMSDEAAAAPALALGVILPRFLEFCVPRPVCKALRKDAVFEKLTSDANRSLMSTMSPNHNTTFQSRSMH